MPNGLYGKKIVLYLLTAWVFLTWFLCDIFTWSLYFCFMCMGFFITTTGECSPKGTMHDLPRLKYLKFSLLIRGIRVDGANFII